MNGTCVASSVTACPEGFYTDKESFKCEQCSSSCKDCEFDAGQCVECWEFWASNILNWKDYTCVSECPKDTYFD